MPSNAVVLFLSNSFAEFFSCSVTLFWFGLVRLYGISYKYIMFAYKQFYFKQFSLAYVRSLKVKKQFYFKLFS